MAQKIFAFGGTDYGSSDWRNDHPSMSSLKKSAEVYDVVKNSWKKLPDMPEEGAGNRCVRI